MRLHLRTAAVTMAMAAAVALSACGGTPSSSEPVGGPAGDPVPGGTGRIIDLTEPRTLDPGIMANEASNESVLGNALYGTLVTNDPVTRETQYKMAQSLTTDDGGQTFTLTLRPGLVFSDGTPLTADDVRFNWEHMKDPKTASPYAGTAGQIGPMQVVDDRTLKVSLLSPNTSFATTIYETALNWIAKPETIQAGQAEIDARPVGAGPYVLEQWRRQDVITLKRNDRYWDAPRPYLDRLEIRAISDGDQRFNTLTSGAADVAQETVWQNLAKAQDSGLQNHSIMLGGGVALVLNTKRAPFDDVRARKAFSMALDLNLIDDAVNDGKGRVPTTYFDKDSPFYRDIPLHTLDRQQAQALFDQLAAEGKPVSFAVTMFGSTQTQRLAESLQTQLSTFRNVTMKSNIIDVARYGGIMGARDFDVVTSSIPETGLWLRLRGGSGNNFSGIDDPQLNQALDDSRRVKDTTALGATYEAVQRRLADLTPVIFYSSVANGVVANGNVGGVQQYGKGSLLPETMWIQH